MLQKTPSLNEGLRLSSQLCFAAYSVAHAFNRVYKPVLDPLGLTYPQYLVLLVLWEEEGLAVKEIGQRLHLDSGTLTPLLKRMERAGFVQRARDPQDERQVRITLTDKGRELQEPVAEARGRVACATGMPLEELNALKEQIDHLRANLDASTSQAETA